MGLAKFMGRVLLIIFGCAFGLFGAWLVGALTTYFITKSPEVTVSLDIIGIGIAAVLTPFTVFISVKHAADILVEFVFEGLLRVVFHGIGRAITAIF